MELLKVFTMPFQPASLLFVAGSSLLLGLVLGSGSIVTVLLGLWMMWITLVWLTRYAFRMIDDIANGVRKAAPAEVEMANPFGDARCWVHPVLAMVLIVMHARKPELPLAPTLIGAALLFPASIGASAMSGYARDALNPLAVAHTVRGMGPWYMVAVLGVSGCAALGMLLKRALGPGWLLFAGLELLLLLAYACIGGVVYLRRIELGFTPRSSPERRDEILEQQRTARRQQLLDELFRDVRMHDTTRAVADAKQWLQAAAAHELAGDVQAILAAGSRWNEPREFARLLRGLLPVLLQLRQPALAFAAAEAGLTAHTAFAPTEETATVTLIDYALQTGRRRTAARLLGNFLAAPGSGAAPGTRLAGLREKLLPPA